MAEAKYDLLLVPTKTDGRIYNQPWYKERLHTRYIKSLRPSDTSQFLRGPNWTFVKDGLDDFRDGLPPPVEGGVVIKGSKGLTPIIQGSSDNLSAVKQPAVQNRFNKHQVCYSRVTPQQQQRREHIGEIEYGLMQHPLALYPHLEECMPPDVFENVVDLLDPEMNLASDDEEAELYEDEKYSNSAASPVPQEDTTSDKPEEGDEAKVRNPYRWIPRKDDKENEKKDMSKKKSERRTSSPSQDEHIKKVTKDFCDWVSSLGGESNNIEESTITSLFASGYETKPALSVPIHVVELTNVPMELRNSANVPLPPPAAAGAKVSPTAPPAKKEWTHSGTYEPSWAQFKYGAWYLPAKTWKKRDSGQPLQDPQELKDQEMSEAKKKSNALDGDLAPMHGAKAFMDFIDKKSVRRPEFLDRVAEIQEQTAKEEQAKLAAELAKQKKQNEKKATSAK